VKDGVYRGSRLFGDSNSKAIKYLIIALVIVSELSVSGSETYLVIAYTKLSLCLTFSLIRTRTTSLDSLLLGTDMRRSKVNTCAWCKHFRFRTTFLCSTQRTKRCLVRLQRLPKALSIGTRPYYVGAVSQ